MTFRHAVEPATQWKQILMGMKRYYRLFWSDRNTFFTILALCTLNAVITGSGFYAAPKTASGSFERSGALFFTVAYFCLNALTEVGKTVNSCSILLKQHNLGVIHPGTYAVIQTIADIPSALIQSLLFACCYYFLIGLSNSASQFFIFVLIAFVHYSAISTMFRMLGAWAPSLNLAHLFAGCALPVACLYSGYAPLPPAFQQCTAGGRGSAVSPRRHMQWKRSSVMNSTISNSTAQIRSLSHQVQGIAISATKHVPCRAHTAALHLWMVRSMQKLCTVLPAPISGAISALSLQCGSYILFLEQSASP